MFMPLFVLGASVHDVFITGDIDILLDIDDMYVDAAVLEDCPVLAVILDIVVLSSCNIFGDDFDFDFGIGGSLRRRRSPSVSMCMFMCV